MQTRTESTTARATVNGTTPDEPVTDAKKRAASPAKLAATAFDKLEQLDTDEARELAESPADIRQRFAAKREKVIAELPEGVAVLVQRMRAQ